MALIKLAGLWDRTSPKGNRYLSAAFDKKTGREALEALVGMADEEVRLVGFPVNKKSDKAPDWDLFVEVPDARPDDE